MQLVYNPFTDNLDFVGAGGGGGGGSIVWVEQSTSSTLTKNQGYFASGTPTLLLPASPTIGNFIYVIAVDTNPVIVQANTGQFIEINGSVSSSGGTATNSMYGDVLGMYYRVVDSTWYVTDYQGLWTLA